MNNKLNTLTRNLYFTLSVQYLSVKINMGDVYGSKQERTGNKSGISKSQYGSNIFKA